jgi:hypothetical protein
MRKMKFFSVVFAALFLGLTANVWSQCVQLVPVQQKTTGSQTGLTGTLGTDIKPFYWQTETPTNNSGTVAVAGMMKLLSGTTYYIFGNWHNPGNVGCPGNPPAATSQTTFLTDHKNGSTGNGEYILVTHRFVNTTDGYNFDGLSPNAQAPVAIPTFSSCNLAASGLHYNVTMAWPAITALSGIYDVAPASNVITGIRIRWAGGAAAPASDIANWPNILTTVNTSGAGTDPGGITSVALPDGPLPSGGIWFRMFLVYGGGVYESAFGGPAIAGGTPTASGIFVQDSVSASRGQVTVNWRTNVESAVAGFDVVYSRTKAGTFTLVPGTETAPKGNNSAYSVTFPKPVRVEKLFFKVQAHMTDGSSQFSDIMKLGDDASKSGLGKVLPD